MTNIYDYAYSLDGVIRNSDEYQQLKQCYEELEKNETEKKMYDQFRNMQLTLQQKQMKGEKISEEEIQITQKQQELVQQSKVVSNVVIAEQQMGEIINNVNSIITSSLEELYNPSEEKVN